MNTEVFQAAKSSIKSSFSISSWWKFTNTSVQNSINVIIENLETLGIPFRDSFRGCCSLNAALRKLRGTRSSDQQSVLFGNRLTEEEYQVAIEPSKFCLGLDEWEKPGEADVYACRQLCDQIDLLDSIGLFQVLKQTSSNLRPDIESGEWKFKEEEEEDKA